MVNVLVSGKLGDLFHTLYIPFCHHKKTGELCRVFMTDQVEFFENGLINTYNELKEIVRQQDWCGGFEIWDNQKVDYDTTKFRNHHLLYGACWTELLTSLFFHGDEPIGGGWIKWDSEKHQDRLVVNRRFKNPLFPHIQEKYEEIFSRYSEIIFLGSTQDYDLFPLKERCLLVVPQTVNDWVSYISGCSYFIGNQSGPLAIASSLNVKRLGELLPRRFPDWIHYWDEIKYGDIEIIQ